MESNIHIFHGLNYKVAFHAVGNKRRTSEKEGKQGCNAGTTSQGIMINLYKKSISKS